MGLLTAGVPLTWAEARKHVSHVKEHAVRQFLAAVRQQAGRRFDPFKCGDEIEYMLVHCDTAAKHAALLLTAPEVIEALEKAEPTGDAAVAKWHPEYARYMVEALPAVPFCPDELLRIPKNMRLRRESIERVLGKDTGNYVLTLTSWPQLGMPACTEPRVAAYPPLGPAARSAFVPDEAIAPHPRFPTLTRNIRERRGSKVTIAVPAELDANTKVPVWCGDVPGPRPAGVKDTDIYMDCQCFGMGCCCLQCTLQLADMTQARYMYDQLAIVSPLMLALSAASPAFRGMLAGVDARWDVIGGSVDDRTPAERGAEPPLASRAGGQAGDPAAQRVYKPRFSTISCFISSDARHLPEYDDVPVERCHAAYDACIAAGVDVPLARHVGRLLVRDPLVIYTSALHQDDECEIGHYENIQSTTWESVRFKIPPARSDLGWRVEFRMMEVQITDYENAAYVMFVILLCKAILCFDLNFYMPMSLVDENAATAQQPNAALAGRFRFRRSIMPAERPTGGASGPPESDPVAAPRESCSDDRAGRCERNQRTGREGIERMTLDEIFNGKGADRPGLLCLVRAYLDTLGMPAGQREAVEAYLRIIEYRASGRAPTAAVFIRNYIKSHPAYKHDSLIPGDTTYDLVQTVMQIRNDLSCPAGRSLLGGAGKVL